MGQKSKTDEIYHFYRTKKENHSETLQNLKKRIHHIGTLRLLLIIGMIVSLWLLHDKDLPLLIAILCICSCFFLLLIIYHTRLYYKRTYEEGLIRLFEGELKALDYDFSLFDGAPEQTDTHHSFSLDLDLFGNNSLFQSINRTVTITGKETLINRFKQPSDDKKKILMCQDGIKEMRELSGFRHKFYVTGEMASKENNDIKFLFSNKESNNKISNNLIFRIMTWFIPAIWVLLAAGALFNIVPTSLIGIYFIVSIMLSNLPAKRIQKVHTSVNKTEKILKTYAELMEQIEYQKFNSAMLQAYQHKLNGKPLNDNPDPKNRDRTEDDNRRLYKKISASSAIKKLSRNIGALDQRFSTIGVILNLLYMRDTRQAIKLEKWKEEYSGKLKDWFEALGVFDAFCSLGTFAFNHPDYIYPTIADSYFEMNGKALGHPLIHRDKCVRNDIHVPDSKYFLIITGANMAGKSTYLRTIGVNFLFACIGLPVYAESLTVYPAHLVTSLRTADSLISNESYFFAELKRLKMIIDRLNEGEKLFIILDEILKGTNSVDKQKGSISLIKQLINKGTCGIIATHDLLLGSLSETFPENVRNKRFEADIKDNELSFTYQIRDGIAQNMNATFLMKKMGIFEKE